MATAVDGLMAGLGVSVSGRSAARASGWPPGPTSVFNTMLAAVSGRVCWCGGPFMGAEASFPRAAQSLVLIEVAVVMQAAVLRVAAWQLM